MNLRPDQSIISADNSKKIALLSFVMMFLVVMIHVPRIETKGLLYGIEWFAYNGVCRMAVPFFFCVSGYMLARHLYCDHWWRDALLKRVVTIGIPYVIFCVFPYLVAIFLAVLANLLHGEVITRNLHTVNCFQLFGLDPWHLPSYSVQLWYLRAILVMTLLSPLFAYIMRKGKLFSFGLLAFFFILNCWSTGSVLKGDPNEPFVTYFISFNGWFYFLSGFHLFLYPPPPRHTQYSLERNGGGFVEVSECWRME